MSAPSLLTPYGYSSSTCGYCSPSGTRSQGATSKKYGMQAPQMSCQLYQNLIDRGWRRSGDYVYHPDMARTCCPQYTIRLDALAYKPSKKHRQVVNRFNRYLSTGLKPGEEEPRGSGTGKEGKGKGKAKEWDFATELKAFEEGYGEQGHHRYTTELVPAKASTETFELYKRYQISVHKDPPEKVTMRGFSRFLCDSPLREATIRYRSGINTERLPKKYGSYHLLYKIDDKIIGISVVDILPHCVSSVYFIWDPEWAWASLGKLSTMREIALARDIREAGVESMGWVYMGYWIAGCGKMRYKSEYSPSFLLDPGTNEFHPLTDKLDKFLQSHPQGYFPFDAIDSALQSTGDGDESMARDGDGSDGDLSDIKELDTFPASPAPGFTDPSAYDDQEIDSLLVYMKPRGIVRARLVQVSDLQFRNSAMARTEIRELTAAVGMDLMAKKGGGIEGVKDKGILYFG